MKYSLTPEQSQQFFERVVEIILPTMRSAQEELIALIFKDRNKMALEAHEQKYYVTWAYQLACLYDMIEPYVDVIVNNNVDKIIVEHARKVLEAFKDNMKNDSKFSGSEFTSRLLKLLHESVIALKELPSESEEYNA